MVRNLPYTVAHDLHGQTLKPSAGEVIPNYRGGPGFLVRTTINGMVFVNKQVFTSRLEALGFLNQSMHEGCTIEESAS